MDKTIHNNKRTDSDVLKDGNAAYHQNSTATQHIAAAKRTKMTNMLTLLDENSLLQVLLRTRCEDHNALRQTCRRFQSIIDSELFRQQRAQQEWAQVETRILTAGENSKKDDLEGIDTFRNNYCELGCQHYAGVAIQNEFRVMVDGKVGGSGKFTLIERNNKQVDFYSTCNDISQEVHETGSLFFDKNGRPRLPSLKNAILLSTSSNNDTGSGGGNGSDLQKDYFVYLDRFKLNPEHRQNATYVGAKAIRSLLLDSPLKDKWSVVIYIADVTAHQTEQDQGRARKQDMLEQDHFRASLMGEMDEEREEEDERALQESNDWKERSRSLAKVDLCQFLRCGFQQTTDSFQKSPCLYAMALPAFFSRPMLLSHKEALAVNIVDKKDLLSSSGNHEMYAIMDTRLSRFMIHSCTRRHEILSKQSTPPPTREQVAGLVESEFDIFQRESDANERIAEQTRQSIVETMESLNRSRTQLEEWKEMLSQFTSTRIDEFDESRREAYQEKMVELQQFEDSVESRFALLQESMSVIEEHSRIAAEQKEEFESLRSRTEALIDETVQQRLSAHTEALTTARADLTRHDMAVKAEIAKLVGEKNNNGATASVKNSYALHACAAHMIPEYIDLLLEFTPQAERRCALNTFDDGGGLTPLMVVVIATHLSSNPDLRIRMAEKLIALGADKNITDVFGEMALGKFRWMRRSAGSNFGNLFGRAGQQLTQAVLDRERMRMEQLLRPFGGPTAADDSYLGNASDEVESEEEEDHVDED